MFSLSDKRAVIYSKNALDTGDTLVILHPHDYKPMDPSGFPLNRDLRVHSKRLIATESKKFEKIFSPKVQRAARLCHYPDGLPRGIDYILDLRVVAAMNLEEGPIFEDMTQNLISQLTCSVGIRSWSKSQSRCGIPHCLVSGQDPIAATDSHNAPTPRLSKPNSIPPLPLESLRDFRVPIPTGLDLEDPVFQSELLRALKLSVEEQAITRWDDDDIAGYQTESDSKDEDVLEYCPVRYRSAIEHLLQIIEGMEPTWLDSAPKVWTLYVVAKYFECTNYVTDRIFAWMFAPRNEIFFETLPEASLKMGFGLKNALITRPAFAILVSEEALRIAGSESPPHVNVPKAVLDKVETRFLRRLESLDHLHTRIIEQAGKQFYDRVKRKWEYLTASNMVWLGNLPEWEKIHKMKAYLKTLDDDDYILHAQQIIEELDKCLTDYVRAPLIRCLYESIPSYSTAVVNKHRRLQQYLTPYKAEFKSIYDGFSSSERVMTRFLWQILSELSWRPTKFWNFDDFNNNCLPSGNPFIGKDAWIADEHGVRRILTSVLEGKIDVFNDMIHVSGCTEMQSIINEFNDTTQTPKFNLTDFLAQVGAHVRIVCREMLDRFDMDWATTTDTLLCLSEEDYACLSDWEEKTVTIDKPEKLKENCEISDLSDWTGAEEESIDECNGEEEGSMGEWDLIDD